VIRGRGHGPLADYYSEVQNVENEIKPETKQIENAKSDVGRSLHFEGESKSGKIEGAN
jgi:hypothetical protein